MLNQFWKTVTNQRYAHRSGAAARRPASQKLEIPQVAELTKIKTDYLRALEEGHYETFTAPVYIRGFVRTYASVVKLEAKPLLAQLDAELAQNKKFKTPPSLLPQKRGLVDRLMLQLSRLKWRVAVPVVLLVIGIMVFVWVSRAWQTHKAKNPVANIGPGLYKPAAPNGDVLPLPTNAPAR